MFWRNGKMIIKLNSIILDKLTSTEKKVINYINNNYKNIPNMSIIELANETYTSPATVSRAVKKCQLNGFAELRYKISEEMDNEKNSETMNNVLEKSLKEISNTIDYLSLDDILESVKIIKNSKKIYVLARGLSELVANEFSLKLQLLSYDAFQISDPNIIISLAQDHLSDDDTLCIFSLYGKTESLIKAAENATSIGCKVISSSCSDNSSLKKLSDIYLQGYKHEHHSIKNFEVSSRLPLNVIARTIIDYLAQS